MGCTPAPRRSVPPGRRRPPAGVRGVAGCRPAASWVCGRLPAPTHRTVETHLTVDAATRFDPLHTSARNPSVYPPFANSSEHTLSRPTRVRPRRSQTVPLRPSLRDASPRPQLPCKLPCPSAVCVCVCHTGHRRERWARACTSSTVLSGRLVVHIALAGMDP
jgi:hypothetical protein